MRRPFRWAKERGFPARIKRSELSFPLMSEKSPLLNGFLGGVLGAAFLVGGSGVLVAQDPAARQWLGEALLVPAASPRASAQGTAAAPDVSDVVAQANPAVVSIVISKDVPVMEQYMENPFGGMFPGFGFSVPRSRQIGTEKKDIGGGSGFLISADGYVVTNAHVVNDQNADYTVFTNDGTKYDAKVVSTDEILDVAVVKIEGKDLPFLTFADSDQVKLGQPVIAIGNALAEFRNTVSVGVISGLSRSITAGDGTGRNETLENVIQTDAAINPGNSGGPLLALDGTVLGVNVATANGAENIGFSLPANAVKQAVDSIRQNGRVIRAFLGVRTVPVTEALKQKNNLSVDQGALVVRGDTVEELAVMPGSPADKAGLAENDIILEVDGVKLTEEHTLQSVIRSKAPGARISLKVLHKGERKTVWATLTEAPKS